MTKSSEKGRGSFIEMSDLIPGQLYRIKSTLSKTILNTVLASMITMVRPHARVSGRWVNSHAEVADRHVDHDKIPAHHLRGRMAMFIGHRWPGNESWGVFLVGEKFLVLEGYHLESNQPVKWAV